MDEEHRELVDDLMWKGEMAMRDRGLSDAEIAAKKRQLQEMLEKAPPNAAQWEMLERIDGGEPAQSVLPDFGKDAWLVRIAGNRVLLGIGLLVFAAALGYVGGLNRGNTHRIAGIPGLVVGVAIAVFAIVYATFSVRRRRRS